MSSYTIATVGRRTLWVLVVLGIFVANTLFCYHIAEHQTKTAAGDALSLVLETSNARDENLPVFAVCLLTRDDLPILPEWIAYHYHAVNLRHLVLAVDPLSAQDPKPVLDNFREHLGSDKKSDDPLVIEEWQEADFMPDYFVKGEYGKAPHMLGGNNENSDSQTWEEYYSSIKNFGKRKIRDQTLVNSHRYRQTRFLSQCSKHLREIYGKETPVWMSTLDSDEYMAVNPWVMQEDPTSDQSILRLEKGGVLRWLVEADQKKKERTQASDLCLQVPRLLFGAVELSPNTTSAEKLDADVTHGFVRLSESNALEFVNNLPRHSNRMETLRWKFHAAPNDKRNFQQKVVLKLLEIPDDDELWGDHVHTVHRPSRKLCSPESDTNSDGALLVPSTQHQAPKKRRAKKSAIEASPVVAFHYIGSEERYFSRPNDFRRNLLRYQQRSNITHARDETGWIDQWLERFVNDVGIETASALLANYVVDAKDIVK